MRGWNSVPASHRMNFGAVIEPHGADELVKMDGQVYVEADTVKESNKAF